MRKLALAAALLAAPLYAQNVRHYSTAQTRIGTLLADPAAKALIARHFPYLVNSRQVAAGMANRMTLRSLKRFKPDMFTDARLTALDAEFNNLPAQ